MSEDFGENIDTGFEEEMEDKKDNKIWIIIAVVAVLLCCCCAASIGLGYWLWNNGDDLFGISYVIGQSSLFF
jgi:hypothetical protein